MDSPQETYIKLETNPDFKKFLDDLYAGYIKLEFVDDPQELVIHFEDYEDI